MTGKKTAGRPLTGAERFFFYGLHGLFDEIVFTAIFDAIFEPTGNRKLKGYSTIFSFFIYGGCSFFVEQLYRPLMQRNIPLFGRVLIYVSILYIWELTSGLILRQFDACSWDYSHYNYNFLGLITLEYAPAWFLISIWQDVLFKFILSLTVNFEPAEKES